MNCNELDNYLHEFVDRELPAAKRAEVANHLASCHRCTIKAAELEEADRSLRTLKAVEPPPDFLQQVRAKISEEQEKREVLLATSEERVEVQSQESFWRVLEKRLFAQFWFKLALGGAAAIVLVSTLIVMNRPHEQLASRRTYQMAKKEPQNQNERAPTVPSPSGAASDDLAYKDKKADRETANAEGSPRQDHSDLAGVMRAGKEEIAQREPAKLKAGEDSEARAELKQSPPATKAPAEQSKEASLPARDELAKKLGDADTISGLTASEKAAEPTATAAAAATGVRARETGVGGKAFVADGFVASDKPAAGADTTSVAVATQSMPSPATVQPMAPPLAPSSRAKAREANRAQPLATPSKTSLTNLPPGVQTGWLDLATRIFYIEFGKTSSGAFVRGRLDEKNEFIVTSTEVEGQVVELDAKQAATKGTYGWLGLSSQRFVAARPGLKPSYPYIEGYQDNQGEFHPTSRRIYRAGD